MQENMPNLANATVFDLTHGWPDALMEVVAMSWLQRFTYDVADDYAGDFGQMSEWYGAPFLHRSRVMPLDARD